MPRQIELKLGLVPELDLRAGMTHLPSLHPVSCRVGELGVGCDHQAVQALDCQGIEVDERDSQNRRTRKSKR